MRTIDEMKQERDGQLAFGRPIARERVRPNMPPRVPPRSGTAHHEGDWRAESLGAPFASDAMEVAARKKIGAPPEWKAFQWEVVDHKNIETSAIRVRGSVPIGTRRDGRPRWGKVSDADSAFIYREDVEAAKQEYERESGKCADCIGGLYCCGASVDLGFKYRPCSRCDGKGTPPFSVQHRNDGGPNE